MLGLDEGAGPTSSEQDWEWALVRPVPSSSRAPKVVFDHLHISRIAVDLSLRTARSGLLLKDLASSMGADQAHSLGPGQAVADLLVSMIAAVVLNVDQMRLRLAPCRIASHLSSYENFAGRLSRFYVKSGALTLLNLIGSLDLLGGPLERVRELGVGVRQVTFDPLQARPPPISDGPRADPPSDLRVISHELRPISRWSAPARRPLQAELAAMIEGREAGEGWPVMRQGAFELLQVPPAPSPPSPFDSPRPRLPPLRPHRSLCPTPTLKPLC